MSDYEATVVRIEELHPVPGLDNLVRTRLLGADVLVGKDTQIGDVGIVFTSETQLSDEYASANNLYRDSSLNADPTKKGYLDANRRIRAIKFMGCPSNGLFMPLSSLPEGAKQPKVGQSFTTFAGKPICGKYESPNTRKAKAAQVGKPRREPKNFPRHVDTLNWFKSHHLVADDELLLVTQKLHGTSIRIGNIALELPWYKKLAQKLGFKVKTHGPVVGSRNVIKDLNDEKDLWVRVGKPIAEQLAPNTVVFGEIVGWDGNKPIQPGYTYDLPKGQCALYTYNMRTASGMNWANTPGNAVPIIAMGIKATLDVNDYLNRRFATEGIGENPVPLSDPKSVDEGVCIRVLTRDGSLRVFKAKSSQFLEYETKQLDKGSADLESVS